MPPLVHILCIAEKHQAALAQPECCQVAALAAADNLRELPMLKHAESDFIFTCKRYSLIVN